MRHYRAVPRKPTLSPTRFSIYLACPVKYRWTYVDARGRWLLRAKSYYSFGATLHKALERFHDSDDTGVTTTDELINAYEESWIDAGFSSAEEMAEAYGEGLEILEQHAQLAAGRPEGVKTLYVEKQLRYDLGRFLLVGRADRIDEYPDGSLEIVDYKSGRIHVSEEDVATDLAMSIYQFLLAKQFPGRKVSARIVALRSGTSAASGLPPEEYGAFEQDIRALGENILDEVFQDLVPRPKSLCERCDFLKLCLQHEEFADQWVAG